MVLVVHSKLRLVRECLILPRIACYCYFGAKTGKILRYYHEQSERVSDITSNRSSVVMLVTSEKQNTNNG
jgi:hypothetical protein